MLVQLSACSFGEADAGGSCELKADNANFETVEDLMRLGSVDMRYEERSAGFSSSGFSNHRKPVEPDEIHLARASPYTLQGVCVCLFRWRNENRKSIYDPRATNVQDRDIHHEARPYHVEETGKVSRVLQMANPNDFDQHCWPS